MKKALLAVLVAALSISGCNYHEAHDSVHPGLYSYLVTVENRTGEVFDIDLDGHFLASVGGFDTVHAEVREGSHTLAAFDHHGNLRAARDFYLDRDFVWVLER